MSFIFSSLFHINCLISWAWLNIYTIEENFCHIFIYSYHMRTFVMMGWCCWWWWWRRLWWWRWRGGITNVLLIHWYIRGFSRRISNIAHHKYHFLFILFSLLFPSSNHIICECVHVKGRKKGISDSIKSHNTTSHNITHQRLNQMRWECSLIKRCVTSINRS